MSSASTSDINKTPSHHGRALTKEAKRLNSIRGTQRFTKPSQTNGYIHNNVVRRLPLPIT